MVRVTFSFLWIIVACGVASLAMIFGNLALLGAHRDPEEPRLYVDGGDPSRGRDALLRYGCGGCHVIPGVRAAQGRVGPSLADIRAQVYIAGVLHNSPDNMVRWLVSPQEINPRTAMPDLEVTEEDARDMAAYLYRRAPSPLAAMLGLR